MNCLLRAVYVHLIEWSSFPRPLLPNDTYGVQTLKELPWLAAELSRGAKEQWPAFLPGQYELKGRLEPVLISFRDIKNVQSIVRVTPSNVFDVVGEKIVVESIWVEMTHDQYKSFGIEKSLPWPISDFSNPSSPSRKAFYGIGLPAVSNPFKH
ncbi:hypothetical protein [Pseudodesulfovibrio profundus]|nr:hypothetical protein [Pseudodesulfovibrio profundus]